jgi:hypothetical protein
VSAPTDGSSRTGHRTLDKPESLDLIDVGGRPKKSELGDVFEGPSAADAHVSTMQGE